MPLYENFLKDPNWWFGHLHEAAARGAGDDEDYDELLQKVFGVTLQDNNRFWKETIMMEEENGFWSQIHIGLPKRHVISVIYFGFPRYDVEYRYSSPLGESVLFALEGGHSVLPGLRWAEVKAVASLVPDIAPSVLLLLTPVANVSANEEKTAKMEINQALFQLGFSSPASIKLAEMLVRGIRLKIDWFYDESYGWVTNYPKCWRCSPRSQYRLKNIPERFFFVLKNFTDYLGLNEETTEMIS